MSTTQPVRRDINRESRVALKLENSRLFQRGWRLKTALCTYLSRCVTPREALLCSPSPSHWATSDDHKCGCGTHRELYRAGRSIDLLAVSKLLILILAVFVVDKQTTMDLPCSLAILKSDVLHSRLKCSARVRQCVNDLWLPCALQACPARLRQSICKS